jgi:hypothetical protein
VQCSGFGCGAIWRSVLPGGISVEPFNLEERFRRIEPLLHGVTNARYSLVAWRAVGCGNRPDVDARNINQSSLRL